MSRDPGRPASVWRSSSPLWRTPVDSSTCTRIRCEPAPAVTAPSERRSSPRPAGLVDRRTYPDREWTEMARQSGSRITMIILTDPGHRISAAATRAIPDPLG